MATLISSDEIAVLTGIFYDNFQTFAFFNTIRVNKSPLETIINTGLNYSYGYGGASQENNIVYTPVYQDFNAIVKYNTPTDKITMTDIKIDLSDGEAMIKVDNSARNYIEDGKTENVNLNGYTYNIISDAKVQNYLGLRFYYYKIGKTK